MTIEILTCQYEASHGKKPRGTGCWAFSEKRNPSTNEIFLTQSMSYAEAKKEAKKHFAGKAEYIYVQG